MGAGLPQPGEWADTLQMIAGRGVSLSIQLIGSDGPINVSPFSDSTREPSVRGFLHVPEDLSGDTLVLTHGAGANCESPLLIALATTFCESGLTILRCDLPFRQLRPHGPPPRGSAERDQEGLRNAVEAIRQKVSGRVFLGGHSYGGRQATMLAAVEPELVDGLRLLSYPLHPPKKPGQLRTDHFQNLRAPVLFVHGSRDGFGSIEELNSALKLIPARTELVTVQGAGHELASSRTVAAVTTTIAEAFWKFFVQ
jgi:predicted alpha/beta-hydrolase family hydrolase